MVRIPITINNRGVTLIELIVALGLSSIVLTLVLGIFFTGTKLYKYVNDSMEIQQQGHFIMDFITTKVMPSSEIDTITGHNNASYYNKSEEIELKEIELIDDILEKQEKHIFSIQEDEKVEGKSIRYGKSKIAKVELGNYIKKAYASPLPKGCIYKDADGIALTIEMQKGDASLKVFKSIYFRK